MSLLPSIQSYSIAAVRSNSPSHRQDILHLAVAGKAVGTAHDLSRLNSDPEHLPVKLRQRIQHGFGLGWSIAAAEQGKAPSRQGPHHLLHRRDRYDAVDYERLPLQYPAHQGKVRQQILPIVGSDLDSRDFVDLQQTGYRVELRGVQMQDLSLIHISEP